jgi:hypothetical protein
MPGHVKRGGAGEADPDPAPYLFISYEEKQKEWTRDTVSRQSIYTVLYTVNRMLQLFI